MINFMTRSLSLFNIFFFNFMTLLGLYKNITFLTFFPLTYLYTNLYLIYLFYFSYEYIIFLQFYEQVKNNAYDSLEESEDEETEEDETEEETNTSDDNVPSDLDNSSKQKEDWFTFLKCKIILDQYFHLTYKVYLK